MKIELPKSYEPKLYEDEIYKKWEKSGFFNPDNLNLAKDAKNYSIVMPPPNVTGTLHMGHASMLALEDILIRYHRMKGERTLWVPGTDHAAIATQTKVEKLLKEKGEDRHKLGREKFLKEVNEFAHNSHDTIVKQVKKMGSSCDWSREAYTLDEIRTKAVRSVFKMMHDDGLIYRGERIVNWCPRCESTLADDEIEYKTQKAKFYTFRYAKNFPIAISTTRPETKLGDTAVAVNPIDNRYKEFVGRVFEVDFAGVKLNLKVIADRSVDMNFGTGALGVTPAHSIADWQMAEANDLPVIKVIDEKGKIREGFCDYSHLSVKQAREKIVERLREAGLMDKEEEIENNLSLCYRCDTPVEPLPSEQWFINVNKRITRNIQHETHNINWQNKSIKEIALEVMKTGKIKIVPERFTKNYYNWMENLRDWCISRQIWFGHRVPVWYKGKSKVKSLKSNDDIYVGVEAPEDDEWVQDEDTLDTWFSSGLWTFSTLAKNADQIKIEDGQLVIDSEDFNNFHPTAVLETGYDILFFWIARMIIMTTYAVGDIPFHDVYLHGLVLDEKGKKMSKSKGNVIDPLDMCEKYGTDATRLSLIMGTTPGNDIRLSEEKIAGYRNFVNKLWNIARYVITNYELRIMSYEFENNNLTISDKWILGKMENLIKDVSDDIDNYRFAQAGERLRVFTWDDLADWYLEASKFEKNEVKPEVLSFVLCNILKLWHPFIPFVTEKIWSACAYSFAKASADKEDSADKDVVFDDKHLIIEEWPSCTEVSEGKPAYSKVSTDKLARENFELIKNIIIAIRNARSEHKIEPAKKVKAVIFAGKNKEIIESQSLLIKSLRTGIDEIEIKDKGEKIKDAIYAAVDGVEIFLLGAVDLAKENARIEKEIANLEKLIAGLKNKLTNKEFIDKAPEAIVKKEKEKLDKWEDDLEKLKVQF